jgi:hypothetical protein
MEYKKIVIQAFVSALIGLTLALFYGAFNYILRWLWTGLNIYDPSLSTLIGGQSILLLLFMPILAGIIVAIYADQYIDANHLLTGTFFGLIAGVVLGVMIGVMMVLNTLFLSAGTDTLQYFANSAVNLLSEPAYSIILCASAVISSISASGYLYLRKSRNYDHINNKKQTNYEDRIAILAITVFIMAVILLPQIFAYVLRGIGLQSIY